MTRLPLHSMFRTGIRDPSSGASPEGENNQHAFICHDLALVQLFCDRVIVMHDGHVEEEGTPEEIIEHPKTEYTEQLIRSVL